VKLKKRREITTGITAIPSNSLAVPYGLAVEYIDLALEPVAADEIETRELFQRARSPRLM
jgi:2-keto-3-deoxy-galactonokinase